MPISDIIILALIIVSFLAFAIVLAWGDNQTSDIAKKSRARALQRVRTIPPPPKAKPHVVVHNIGERQPGRAPLHV